MAVAAADDSFILNDEKLEKLAKVVYNQEAEAAKHCKCNSEIERSYCIRETKVCYHTVLELLESMRQLKKELKSRPVSRQFAKSLKETACLSDNSSKGTVRT
ncbi:hypothetical protein FEM48_ZijujUnG0084000 [Ziziphus jujuba var. spinosa]|uniref:Uncharacterized protein n=1 Tax=Ziziphus jujuba var. spinosa TaxID=714518 RepID=A0A978U8M6_ZIZJJ|nr:hypothetical protein FEM48_ZijujUnG0084000 [Ziziphus jujuba var. spinosa]